MTATRIDWSNVLSVAAQIVRRYSTAVTLRQLHYQLLVLAAAYGYVNTTSCYKGLSSKTAELRRRGDFPDLSDRTRAIHRAASWDDPEDAMGALLAQYRVDRTEGQDVSVVLAVEKAGLVALMQAWFGHLGVPILALSGYSSQSYVRDVVNDVARFGRPAVLLYAGDHDPSGEDIDRDFAQRTACWKVVRRVALSSRQVEEYGLPPAMGKSTDSRAAAFVERHGALVQVELDALDPDDLRGLFEQALADWWDDAAYQQTLAREATDRSVLAEALEVVR